MTEAWKWRNLVQWTTTVRTVSRRMLGKERRGKRSGARGEDKRAPHITLQGSKRLEEDSLLGDPLGRVFCRRWSDGVKAWKAKGTGNNRFGCITLCTNLKLILIRGSLGPWISGTGNLMAQQQLVIGAVWLQLPVPCADRQVRVVCQGFWLVQHCLSSSETRWDELGSQTEADLCTATTSSNLPRRNAEKRRTRSVQPLTHVVAWDDELRLFFNFIFCCQTVTFLAPTQWIVRRRQFVRSYFNWDQHPTAWWRRGDGYLALNVAAAASSANHRSDLE